MGKHSLMAAKHAQMYRMKGVNTVGSGSSIKKAIVVPTYTLGKDCSGGGVSIESLTLDIKFDTEVNEILSLTTQGETITLPFDQSGNTIVATSSPFDKTTWKIVFSYITPNCTLTGSKSAVLNTDKGQYSISFSMTPAGSIAL